MIKNLIVSFPKNFARVFWGKNILWHLLAIAITAGIVFSGLDWKYFLFVRGELLNSVFFPAIIIGFFLPIILPVVLIIFGWLRRDAVEMIYGWALMQAAALGWLVSSLYKSITGRVQPDVLNLLADQSRNWNFGFWEHGIFWGWPSSHTTVAFAMVAVFIILFGKKRSIAIWFAVAYAFYIGIAVSLRIHWLSEFVAGAIVGAVVGVTVGKWWREKLIRTRE